MDKGRLFLAHNDIKNMIHAINEEKVGHCQKHCTREEKLFSYYGESYKWTAKAFIDRLNMEVIGWNYKVNERYLSNKFIHRTNHYSLSRLTEIKCYFKIATVGMFTIVDVVLVVFFLILFWVDKPKYLVSKDDK